MAVCKSCGVEILGDPDECPKCGVLFERCDMCGGRGRVEDGFVAVRCPKCDGAAYVDSSAAPSDVGSTMRYKVHRAANTSKANWMSIQQEVGFQNCNHNRSEFFLTIDPLDREVWERELQDHRCGFRVVSGGVE